METGSFWTGEISYLYFNSGIDEPRVLQVLKSPGLGQLERVVFKFTPITDDTLVQLEQMPSLRSICAEGAKVTDAGIDNLIKALPNCQIEVNEEAPTSKIGFGGPPDL